MENWPTVSLAIRMRMRQLDISQAELVSRSGLSKRIAYELIHGKTVRDRSRRTLAAMSDALEWHRDHLESLLQGRIPPTLDERAERSSTTVDKRDEIVAILDRIERHLVELDRKINGCSMTTARLTPVADTNGAVSR
jgi:transcriptional regulator with XRE-family HTH domain